MTGIALDDFSDDEEVSVAGAIDAGDEELEVEIVEDEPAEEVVEENDEGDEGEEAVAAASEDEAEPVEDDDEEEDAELQEIGKLRPKFRKRLDREIRAKKEARTIAINAARYAKEQESIAAALTSKMEATELELGNLRIQFAETLEGSLGDRLMMNTDKLRKAREDGHFEEESKIQSEIDELRYQLTHVRDVRRSLGDPREVKPAAATPEAAPAKATTPAAQAPVNPRVQRWVTTNKNWYGSPKYIAATAAAKAIDAQLAREGYDANTAEYFTELDARIDKEFPTLRKPKSKTQTVAPSGGSRAAAPAAKGKKRVVLTRADVETMRVFGLDHKNPAHLKEYIASKQTSA